MVRWETEEDFPHGRQPGSPVKKKHLDEPDQEVKTEVPVVPRTRSRGLTISTPRPNLAHRISEGPARPEVHTSEAQSSILSPCPSNQVAMRDLARLATVLHHEDKEKLSPTSLRFSENSRSADSSDTVTDSTVKADSNKTASSSRAARAHRTTNTSGVKRKSHINNSLADSHKKHSRRPKEIKKPDKTPGSLKAEATPTQPTGADAGSDHEK
ncbi:hypothetical protein PCANC_26368 [Puccinia coronata f. sp. avenae]|uniref:Uncharacterized protein n=1 Tax=Puccinia coronata f. sp. avenae TaxID=200324 RepID=A0A2N5S4T9_9BASI|nr:hypothetical protein PCANC_26368 [Puccinia coronata f. sp. avenae]